MELMHHWSQMHQPWRWSHNGHAVWGGRTTVILNPGKYEHWAWEVWAKMSATFLLSPLDQLGYVEDEVFQVDIATYLGQPCPLMAPVMGCYFGKRGKQLNWSCVNLAAASLPGHRHHSLNNKLQNHLGYDEIRGDAFRC
jgi:hypothetical protein